MVQRNLDGVYFRVERGGQWCDVCFTDLTDDEAVSVLEGRGREWLQSMCMILRDVIRDIGEEMDLVGE